MSAFDAAAAAVSAEFSIGLQSEYGVAGRRWLAGLPGLLRSLSARWEIELTDPTPRHGYLSLVWCVTRRSETLALKVTVPSTTFTRETAALVAWDGCGMVRLDSCDVDRGAALLQWLDASISLADVPLEDAVEAAGRMLLIMPVVGAGAAGSVDVNARAEAQLAGRSWYGRSRDLGDPLAAAAIRGGEEALARIDRRPDVEPPRLVNHDLHYENVIRDWDGNWTCVDPKPVIGAAEYAIAPLIWRRYRNPEDSAERLGRLCDIAGLDRTLAVDWLLVRALEYLLWSLGAGLTTDPEICRELVGHLTSGQRSRWTRS